MAVSRLPDNHNIPAVTTAGFPPFSASKKSEIALQIAAHLKRVLDVQGQGCPASLRVPSAMDLSLFYQRSILDVLDGLFELKNQHYEYVMNGLDSEIILHDPLCRKKAKAQHCAASWRMMSEELLSPWDSIKQHTRNPLLDILPRKAP